jgi:hypothetical protein
MEEVLKELKSISEVLNDTSDSLTTTLTEINQEINNLNLGIQAWLESSPLISGRRRPAPENYPTPYVHTVEEGALILGYARTTEGWGLAVKEADIQEGFYEGDSDCPFTEALEKTKPMLLLKAARPVRAAAIRLIPLLLQSLKDEGNKLLKDIAVAKKLVKNIKNL